VRICFEHGIGVVYLDTVFDSSSRILEQFVNETRFNVPHNARAEK